MVNNKQIFHAFLFNIRNYSSEVKNIQRREAELNITLPRMNNFDIKQKWYVIFVLLYTPSTKQKVSEWFLTSTIVLNYLILIVVAIFFYFCEITQTLRTINKSIEFELCHMKLTTLNVQIMKFISDKLYYNNWRHRVEIISSYFT